LKLKLKNQIIADHFYNLIELCKKRNPFLVVQMAQKDSLSTKQLKESTSNRKEKNNNGVAVFWL